MNKKYINKEELLKEISGDPFFGEPTLFVLERIGDLQGKVILDSGCGGGMMSIYFALCGARVIGIDINEAVLQKSKILAESYGVSEKCEFILACAEDIPVDKNSIDMVFSRSTLQYMNRRKAFDEYDRVLKFDGRVAIIENMPYNPFINIFRLVRLLNAKTDKDKAYVKSIKGYINKNDMVLLKSRFRNIEIRHYHFVRMASIYLMLHTKMNRDLVRKIDSLCDFIDNKLVFVFPFMRRFAWFITLYCKERA
jgi:ubiquinone/menaquinone biosynthesis C-methylase UbiE